MAWFNDVKYVEAPQVCDCEDGKFEVQIVNIETDTNNYGKLLKVSLGIKGAKNWNAIPYNHVIYEGEYFDAKFSRLCDCFGVDLTSNVTAFKQNDFRVFVGKSGMAEFSHKKTKKVNDGLNANGTPKTKFVTEDSDFVTAKLLPKPKAKNTTFNAIMGKAPEAPATQKTIEQVTSEDEKKMNEIFGAGNTAPLY